MNLLKQVFDKKPKQYCTSCGRLMASYAYPQTYRYDNGKPEPLEYWFKCDVCEDSRPKPPLPGQA